MRSRNIKPGFFVNEELVELPPLTRLLFAGLWCYVDRRGIGEDRPTKIKLLLFPADSFSVDEALNSLHEAGLIHRYKGSDGRHLFVVWRFTMHQTPHQNEKPNTELDCPLGYFFDPKERLLVPEENRTGTGQAPELHQSCTGQAPELHQSDPADSLLPLTDSLNLKPDSLNKKSGSEQPAIIEMVNLPVKVSPKQELETKVDQVIEYFRNTTGKKRVKTKAPANREFIRARLRDDEIPVEDLLAIIDLKTPQVKAGTFPDKYLRIETLFRSQKCQSYLAELDGIQGPAVPVPKRTSKNQAALTSVLKDDPDEGGLLNE